MCHGLASRLDRGDFEVRLRLSMSPALAHVLLGFIVKCVDLLGLALAYDLTAHLRAFYERAANLEFVAVDDHQDLVQIYLRSRLALELFDDEDIILCSLELLSTGLDNRVHAKTPRLDGSGRTDILADSSSASQGLFGELRPGR